MALAYLVAFELSFVNVCVAFAFIYMSFTLHLQLCVLFA